MGLKTSANITKRIEVFIHILGCAYAFTLQAHSPRSIFTFMSDDQNNQNPAEGYTPEQIYQFFKEMPVADLEKLAKDAIIALDEADTRPEAETAVIKMAPFFLDCTFPRLQESLKAKLRKSLDDAEEKHGSLANVLGLDESPEGEASGDEKKS